MWTLNVESGWHEGNSQALESGHVLIGAHEDADILLLDAEVPECLLELEISGSGALSCLFAAEGLQFSCDRQVWSPVRAEPLFSVDVVFRIGAVSFSLVRSQPAIDPALLQSGQTEGDGHAGDSELTTGGASSNAGHHNAPPLPAFLHRLPGERTRQWAQRAWYAAHANPRVLMAGGAGLACVFVGLFAWIISPPPAADAPHPAFRHESGLALSYGLSLGHQAPPGALEPSERTHLLDAEETPVTNESGGVDRAEPGTSMRLSYSLSFGKPLAMPGKVAEPAVHGLQEQFARTVWGDRITLNASGTRLSLRGQLSESDRRDFERILQRTVREHGESLTITAVIEPLEPPPDLQIKQVLGGSNPVIVLQDGSRLMPGSVYEGRVIESISTDRVVLRGKDRIEIPI